MAQANIAERYLKSLSEEKTLLFITLALAAAFYFMTISLNSTYDDNLSYLNIGKELAETGKYTGNFWNRSPTLPFIISLMYLAGMDLFVITIIIPLFFLVLFLVANFLLFRTLYDWKIGMLSTWAVMALPSLWQFGERVLVDVPVAALVTLSILLFYIGMEKDRKYLIPSFVIAAIALLTKISGGAVVIIFLAYIIFRRRWKIFKTKEFLSGVLVSLAFLASVIVYLLLTKPMVFDFYTIYYAMVPQGKDDLIKFLLNPFFFFLPLGLIRIFREWQKEHFINCSIVLVFFGVFLNTETLMRYLAVIFGAIFFISVYGLLWIRKMRFGKHLFLLFFLGSMAVGLINSVYILNFVDSSTRYGAYDLASSFMDEEFSGERVAAGNMAGYLETYTEVNVTPFPYLVQVNNMTLTLEEFNEIVTSPQHELYSEYVDLGRRSIPKDYYYFDNEWVQDNEIRYVAWSVYDEFLLNPVNSYYNIKYAGIEIPIKGAYHSLRPPPDYVFSSEVFEMLEDDSMYKKVKEFLKDGQRIIIVYEVIG